MKYVIFFICFLSCPVPSLLQGLINIPQKGKLYITEIMVDPVPSAGSLPEEEYIEIFNASSDTLSLQGTLIQVGNSRSSLPIYRLPPHQYLLLVGPQTTALFDPTIPILALSKWPRLTNSGQRIQMMNTQEEWLDYFTYSEDWYRDSDKKEGGFSLEKISPLLPSDCPQSWMAHPTESGGSPGTENPISPTLIDRAPPTLVNLNLPDSLTLVVQFDEKINAIDTAQVWLDETLTTWPIAAIEFSYLPSQIILHFSEGLPSGIPLSLRLSGVSDCSNNTLQDTSIYFAFGKKPAYQDLVISEIMFDPYPNQTTFLEVYNRSDQILELGYLQLVKPESNRQYSLPQKWMPPHQYYVLTKDASLLKEAYPWLESAPIIEVPYATFRLSGETLQLQTSQSIVDALSYDPDWHHPLLEDSEGVSLERISLEGPSQEPANWHSAAASVGYATPGLPNSYSADLEPSESKDWLALNQEVIQQGEILLIFYQSPLPGCILTIYVFDMSGRHLATPINQLQVQYKGWVKWTGTDDLGRSLNSGIYIILAQLVHPEGLVQTAKRVVGLRD
ncbi:MAG: lamin tail domain-containing protein [Saprospiraceae bacterium]